MGVPTTRPYSWQWERVTVRGGAFDSPGIALRSSGKETSRRFGKFKQFGFRIRLNKTPTTLTPKR